MNIGLIKSQVYERDVFFGKVLGEGVFSALFYVNEFVQCLNALELDP